MKCITKIKGELKKGIRTLEKHKSFLWGVYYTIALDNETEIRIYFDWGMVENEARITKGKEKILIDINELGLRKYVGDLIADELERRERAEIKGRNRKRLKLLKKLGLC